MYEEAFGTDWETLGRDELLHRAFALGVEEALGESPPRDEIERLRGEAEDRYGRSLVELAYDEGRSKGRRPTDDREPSEVWSSLVEGEGEPARPQYRSSAANQAPRPTDVPSAVSTPTFLELTGTDLDRFDLPGFLR